MKEHKTYPDSREIFPVHGMSRVVFLNNIISNPQIIVGDYTYYDDPDNVYNFEKNVLYLFDFIGDMLRIGKFCQIATGATFIMNGANHPTDGFSTYPFIIFGHEWEKVGKQNVVNKNDTVIGNDVWIGYKATIMPGITIGDGAIIGAKSIVTKDVPPYTVVAGNPAREIRKRFLDDIIVILEKLQWWDWSVEEITKHIQTIVTGNLQGLIKIYHEK